MLKMTTLRILYTYVISIALAVYLFGILGIPNGMIKKKIIFKP